MLSAYSPPPPSPAGTVLDNLLADICAGIDNEFEEVGFLMKPEEEISHVDNIKDATIWAKMHEQLKKKTILVGFHHGKLNPLPSLWHDPIGMNMIQLMFLYQLGNPPNGVLPLRLLSGEQCHILTKVVIVCQEWVE